MSSLDELIALGMDHGCLSGDCPHLDAHDCIESLRGYISQWLEAGRDAREQIDQWRCDYADCAQERADRGVEIERLRVYEALAKSYRELPEQYHRGMLWLLVKAAFEAAEISHGRAAELLGCSIVDIREKGWVQGRKDEEIERLQDIVADRNEAIAALQDAMEGLQKKVTDARDCAMWLRIVLTNMTQDEQMQGVYERWPWLIGDSEF